MSSYERIKKTYQKEYAERSPEYKARISKWRKEPVIVRVEKPSNLATARQKGWKKKKGYVIARARIKKGRRKRIKPALGRKPSKSGRYFTRAKSLQLISEERAGRKYKGLEVLNSYWVGEDGEYKFFEIILVDPKLTGLKMRKGKVFRGLTARGMKARGISRRKG